LEKKAFDGNAAIPFQMLKSLKKGFQSLYLLRADPFLGLPYLVTLGFKVDRPMPQKLVDAAKLCERLLGPLGRINASRILAVWQKMSNGPESST
jgi:hypothetical protein